ncbi:protein SPA1-RELATED 3-like isoform X2 [Curcuma longa]|uniref:protein SPA1-RELATED 3-like isoform X2 n=1 Tax=Curcuma longa TaxID=136217 RepID=UPI003D9DD6A6
MGGSEETSGWARSSSASRAGGGGAFSGSIGFFRAATGCISGWDQEEEEEEKEEFVREEKEKLRRLLSSSGGGSGDGGGDVSLREWLDRPGRPVDILECLHVFRQVVEAVGAAQEQGIVIGNVRPSCFVISPSNRVSFIESTSCSASSYSSSEGEGTEAQLEGPSSTTQRRDADGGSGENNTFPMKRILLMESTWYTSPEEVDGAPGTFASDVFRLGVLLFELVCAFNSQEEKLTIMADLRHRVLPPQLLLNWPKEASFCLWLLHPQPDTRPKMSEVLHSEFLNQQINFLDESESVAKLSEEIEDQELLREFLLHLQYRKLEVAHRLHDTVTCISADIQEIQEQRSVLKQSSCQKLDKDGHSSSFPKFDQSAQYAVVKMDSSCLGARKRLRPDYKKVSGNELTNLGSEDPGSVTELQIDQQNLASKSSRLMQNFKKLEAAYFSARCRQSKSTGRPPNKFLPATSNGTGSAVWTERSSVDDTVLKEGHGGGRKSEWISSFLEDLSKYLSFSKLKVRADLKQGDLLNTMNLVCSIGFDRDKEFFATAGVNKKIKVFECDMILNKDRDIHYPVVEMANKSKLSCICWNSYIKSQIASSDFEGVVQVWDVTRSQSLVEMKEHERRVWSVDFSLADPTKLASGSDDGTVKLWSINKAILFLHLLLGVLVLSELRLMCVLFNFILILHTHLQLVQPIIRSTATISVT